MSVGLSLAALLPLRAQPVTPPVTPPASLKTEDAGADALIGQASIFQNDPKNVAALLDAGTNVNARNADGTTALMAASSVYVERSNPMQNSAIIRLLLDRGADVNLRDNKGETALTIATTASWYGYDKEDAMNWYIGAGANLKAPQGAEALTNALIFNHHSAKLIAAGARFTTAQIAASWKYYVGGTTWLMLAAKNGDQAALDLLLQQGTDASRVDDTGRNVLFYAFESYFAHFQNDWFVQLAPQLLKAGARLDQVAKDGTTLLMDASGQHEPATVAWLLRQGADINARDKNGRNAIGYVAHSKGYVYGITPNLTLQTLWILRDYGADINGHYLQEQTPFDEAVEEQTPLAEAIDNKNWVVVNWLLENGANVKSRDANGDTPLHRVARLQDVGDIVRKLLQRGADSTARNNKGQTPLDVAIASHASGVVQILKENAKL